MFSMFTYRIHNVETNRVHNVSEAFVLSWLTVDQKQPKSKLKELKRDCFIRGHVSTGTVGGGSYLVMTKTTQMDREQKKRVA
jgi:hypothetical protein